MQHPCYPEDRLPELQVTLAALADVEVRQDSDRESLEAWERPDAMKRHFLAQLKERHTREREELVERLAHLQYRVMRNMIFADICLTA